MIKIKNIKAKREKHPTYNVPKKIYDIDIKPDNNDPKTIADSFLKNISSELKIPRDLSNLKFEKTKESILGNHVLYQQYFNNQPISGAWIRVDIDKNGKIYNINNDLVPQDFISKAKNRETKTLEEENKLTVSEIKNLAIKNTPTKKDESCEVIGTERVYYPYKGVPTDSWKVIVKTENPRAEWKIYLDATTGKVLFKINQLKSIDGIGRIFDPNPVVALNDTRLEDNSPIPSSAYKNVVLKELKNNGNIDGPHVNTSTTSNRTHRANHEFIFNRDTRSFKEVMVYYHIDRMWRYIEELGFDNILKGFSIPVNIDGIPDDNSFYSPAEKSLTFGTGGVDDAEDADIILHEYGHAILDNQVPGFGESHEAGAISEAFGDYLAASFFADIKPANLRPTIGNWDAVAYSGDEPPCLRRLDSNKKYPRDLSQEVHNDGEIWAACLWQIREAIGKTLADRLIIASHFLLDRSSSFTQAANAIILADENLNQGSNKEIIMNIFIRRGILSNPRRKNKKAGVPFNEIFQMKKKRK
ncbi:MAG TPA: M36 family metallopeptidase [Nitrososphaeraceae archaeon]|nr:M36 family metallopeptidase [Nitrososphaeraceae archaeon]